MNIYVRILACRKSALCDNEKGAALVIALLLMFLMGILSTMVYYNSSSEVQSSRNYITRQEAFYAAERAAEYARTDSAIYSSIGTGAAAVPRTGINLSVGSSNATGTVRYSSTGNPPRGSGTDVTEFSANFYVVDVTGTGPGNSSVEIESNVARIVPKN